MLLSQGDQTMRQLQAQQSQILNEIDKLRPIGVGGLIELPQLIVCGDQSSGKSSVLEAISRIRFPTNGSTRFVTEVVLRRHSHPKTKVSIEPGDSRTDEQERQKLRSFTFDAFSNGNDLPVLIEQAKECMGITGDNTGSIGIRDDVLKVELSAPNNPELALVDLPGLFHSTNPDQNEQEIKIVRTLTERYMKDTRSIILAVVSAKTDYHQQQVLTIAEKFDPKRERTLGIVTKPDVLEANSGEEDNFLRLVRNDKISLRLGWHALRNWSSETRDISDDARDERENTFFEQGGWAAIPRESVGIENLRHRLSNVLLEQIRTSYLPRVIADIQGKIADRQQKLAKLGNARSTLQQQRGFLLHVSNNFERIASQALHGMYADEFFDGLDGDNKTTSNFQDLRRLRSVVRELNGHRAARQH